MKESLIESVVGIATGTAESTTNALTGTTSTLSGETASSTAPSSASPSPSATMSKTSTPSSISSAAPASSTATSAPVSTIATPSAATLAPTAMAVSARDSNVSDAAPSLSTAALADTTASPTSSTASATAVHSSTTTNVGLPASASSSTQLRGSQEQSHTNANFTGSSDQESGEADTADTGLGTDSIVGLVLGALLALLLLIGLASWCLRRSRQHSESSVSHVRLGATGKIPVFNTRGTERFETSSTSVTFGRFHTARLSSGQDSISDGTGLWHDEVIAAMRIPMEKLTMTKLLSSGGYGEVYRGLYRGQAVAVKVLLPERRTDLDQINAFLAEIKMMTTIDHKCIVQFVGVAWDSPSDLSAVTEFMEGGDLRSLLDRFKQKQRPRGFDLDKARIALQTAQALTYLHSLHPKVLYRDLKSRNILLTSSMNAKVSDLGVSRKNSLTTEAGTSLWMAPEVILGDRYDASADIFSFGVVLSELDSHLYPYAGGRMGNNGQRVADAALLQLVAMGGVRIDFSSNASTELVKLGRACVSLNPLARPSAREVNYQLQLIVQSYEMHTR